MFELSMSYIYRPGNLPDEQPVLNVLWSGEKFLEAKGLAERIFQLMGIDFRLALETSTTPAGTRYTNQSLILGEYASLGILDPEFLYKLGANAPITRLYINIAKMVAMAKPHNSYVPVPKHPPSVEDLAFIVPDRFKIGPLIKSLKHADPKIYDVTILDMHENTRTLHITYLDPEKTLTGEEIAPIREKLLSLAKKKFGIVLKE